MSASICNAFCSKCLFHTLCPENVKKRISYHKYKQMKYKRRNKMWPECINGLLKKKKGSHQSIYVEPTVYQILPVPTDFALDKLTKRSAVLKIDYGIRHFHPNINSSFTVDTPPCMMTSHFSEEFTLEHVYGVKHWTVRRAVLWSNLRAVKFIVHEGEMAQG
jgi:hypothetical protein